MQKEVLIHVRGLQMMDAQGDQEPIEIIVPGQYYFRNGSHYLRYEELLDETAEPTINYIKVSGKGLEVSKKGLVNVHMVFEQGKKNMTYYTTPYGTLQMGISATNLELMESEENLQIKADYALDMNEEIRDIEQRVADEETEAAIYLRIRETGRNLRDGVRKHRGDDAAKYPEGNNPEPEGLPADAA